QVGHPWSRTKPCTVMEWKGGFQVLRRLLQLEPRGSTEPRAEDEEAPTATGETCEIARLPEELLSVALSLTAPRDACRAAAVSPAFRAAADSDAVWACFLPSARDLPPLADGEPPPRSKKDLFRRLSGSPILLPGGLVSMWLDRETGAKCYMVAARELYICWGDTPQYWTWIPLADARFSESAQLRQVCWLDICGNIHSNMLTPGSAYAAYMVYKLADDSYGLDSPAQASVSIGGINRSTRKVSLQLHAGSGQQRSTRRNRRRAVEDAVLPCKRADGWVELELGEFFCEGGEDGDVSFGLAETQELGWKSGLIVQGIEIRRKKLG
uniref:F-box domain-containing protein n=1 Tax=Aegilops tauschii subsp. strangulata TaxID=200361 RepID=A0A453JK41_AEGTS